MMKIVIPVLDEGGEAISAHFGRAPYFAWFEVEEGNVVERGVVPNDSEHFGGIGYPPERIARLEPHAVISPGMGMRAINMFQQMGIAVLQAQAQTTSVNVGLFARGELKELTEGCLHAHDH
jgi:predicted Fe-Mo cluster-binding NifX family protein